MGNNSSIDKNSLQAYRTVSGMLSHINQQEKIDTELKFKIIKISMAYSFGTSLNILKVNGTFFSNEIDLIQKCIAELNNYFWNKELNTYENRNK